MSEKKTAIQNAVSAVKSHGYTLPDTLEKMVADIENPQYRVAVVGNFQVGKSSLINKVFLGDKPLLKEGDGMFCKTAVATDIEYGPSSRMEVFSWKDNTHAEEVCQKVVENPTEEEVTAATVSSDNATRSELARTISRVRITTPNEALQGYTILDTPGLDDTEKELLFNTTFRVVPSSDLALFVIGADKQLGQNLDDFIRNTLLGPVCGISRLMVLVSYKPEDHKMSAERRKEFVQGIKNTLSAFGRSDIPVEMYCYDSSIEDIICDVAELRMTIRTFLNNNALVAREEKLANLLRVEIDNLLAQIAAEIKAAGSSAEEVAALQKRIEDQVSDFKEKCERSFARLREDFDSLSKESCHDVDLAVERAFGKFYDAFDAAPDLDAMVKLSSKAEAMLKLYLGEEISALGGKIKKEIEGIVNRYAEDFGNVQRCWNLFLSEEFSVKRPWSAKIPPIVWDIITVILDDLVLPGGPILAGIFHLIFGGRINPGTWVAKKLVLSQMKKALDNSKGEVRQQLMDQISDGITKTFLGIKSATEDANKAQVAAIRAGLDKGLSDGASSNRAALESAKADLEAALAAL